MADLPSTAGKSRGDLILHEGTWRILHHPYGSGQQAQWVFDEATNDFLRSLDARRVTGSGDNMKIYAGQGDDSVVLDMGKQEHINIYRNLYQGMLDAQSGNVQSVSQSAMGQGAPVDLKALWKDIYPNIEFPDLHAISEYGDRIPTGKTNEKGEPTYVSDASKYNEVIEALEARVGSLTQYGLDKDAGYQVVELGDQYESDIVISDGKVTKIGKTDTATKPSFDPGLSKVGDDLKGYDVLQQRSGQLDPIKQQVDPGYIIDPQTMQPYFQQPDGSLQAAPIPSVDDQISMHLVEGNMDAAVSKANFRDRPTSLEYFNAAMEWARSPADTFTISAIVRGVLEPTPGPMGELRRVGAPPAWATQAWVGLQNSMGIPVESMTSGPGAEPGSVNEMTVASSSGLVPNNFVSPNSAPTTLDGGKSVTQAASTITPSTQVTATTADGTEVNTTAGLAYSENLNFVGENNVTQDFINAVENKSKSGTLDSLSGEQDSREALIELGEDNPNLLNPNSTNFSQSVWQASMYEGSLNQKIDGIMATGATVKPGGAGFIHSDGREWDSAGNLIGGGDQRGDQTGDLGDGEINPFAIPPVGFHNGKPYGSGSVARAAELGISIGDFLDGNWGTGGGEQTFENITDTAATTPYGTDPDDMFVESEADRAARIGTGATLPTARRTTTPSWLAGDVGEGDIWGIGEGARSGFGPGLSSEFRESMEMRGRGTPIRSKAEYGYDIDGNLVITKPSEIIGYEPEDRMGQAEMDVRTGRLPSEDFLGSKGPGGLFSDIGFQTGVLPEKRELPFGDNTPMPVGPANISTPRMSPTSTVGDYGVTPRGGSYQRTEPARITQAYDPDPTISDEYEWFDVPAPEPVYTPPPAPVVYSEDIADVWSPPPAPVVEIDPDDYASRWYDEGADGMRTRDRLSLVGESGPELALFPNGTEIIPLDREMQPDQKRRLRRRGVFADAIDSYQFGGFVGDMGPQVSDLPPDAQTMPAGIREVMSGRPTRAPRSLFRQAGMRAPSAQTISNLLPEEIGVYQEMGRLAGIPDKAFEREFQSMVPMGQGGTRQARFTPRSTGRTRYGSI